MSIPTVNEWADFMPQTLTVEPFTGYTGGGAGRTYGASYTTACRVEMGNHLVVNRQGETVTARGKVFVLSTTIIDVRDRITLPSGYVPSQPPLIDVNISDDESGNHHMTLELQ